MSLSDAVSALFSKTKDDSKEMIAHSSFLTSSRSIVLMGVAGLTLWLAMKGLTDLRVTVPISVIAALYILANSWTKNTQIKVNGEIIKERQRLAWADGTLSPEEAAALTSADTQSASVAAVIKP